MQYFEITQFKLDTSIKWARPVMCYFQKPTIGDFSPKIGPESGGTIVEIEGTYLNIGSKIEVEVAGQNCSVIP